MATAAGEKTQTKNVMKTPELGEMEQQQAADQPEHFQIVWRRLAFRVDARTYDQLIGRALKRVGCLWRLNRRGASASCVEGGAGDESQLATVTTTTANCSVSSSVTGIDQLSLDVVPFATSKQPPKLAPVQRQVVVADQKRVVFENLNGYINSGELTAILGPSGSGKTSLLNAICGKSGQYRGSVQLIGGGKRQMRLSIIPQKDYLVENLTVRENLLFSSKILNSEKNFDHESNIMRCVKMLNLNNCYHSSASNISGGEYKRVSIAQELLRQPDILILDEPTSGLDSLSCKNLIRSLVQLIEASRHGAMNPIAIVMTIHQPDIDIFHMFDHVYFMARGGRCIFDGKPSEAMDTVLAHAGLLPDQLPASHQVSNPANLLIEIGSEDLYGAEPIERLAKVQIKQFEQHAHANAKTLNSAISKLAQTLNNNNDVVGNSAIMEKVSGRFIKFAVNTPTNSDHLLSTLAAKKQPEQPIEKESTIITVPTTENRRKTEDSTEVSRAATIEQPSTITMSSASSTSPPSSSSSAPPTPVGSQCGATGNHKLVRDKRLQAKFNHSGKFWYHCCLLARRSFTSTIRDPLMTLISLIFHLTVPFVLWIAYPEKIGSVTACPVISRELDMVSMVSNSTMQKMEDMQEQLTISLECQTMFFISTYAFSMCSLTVAALSFPMSMHVLLKEVRNGWYNLPAYVLAKTIATFPIEVLFPVMSSIMIYVMLGMPSSYLEWRLWAITLVMAFVSMISHVQGLIFGALCMDSVQTAIFLASATSLPLCLLSGFTARIKHMPLLLQKMSWLSMYRYSSDTIMMIRFGFDTCTCEPKTDEYLQTKKPMITDVPENIKPVFTYYLTSGNQAEPTAFTTTIGPQLLVDNSTTNTLSPTASHLNSTTAAITNAIANSTDSMVGDLIPGVSYDLTLNSTARTSLLGRIENNEVDLFGQMAELMSRSFTYGHQVDNCQSVRSQLLISAGTPSDDYLPLMLGGMIALFLSTKLILFLIVKYKISGRV